MRWFETSVSSISILFPILFLTFFMHPPAEGRSGVYSVSPWCYVRTCVCAYVTFVTRFKIICKFRCNFTSAFLLQLITFIPFGLESWNLVWYLPRARPFISFFFFSFFFCWTYICDNGHEQSESRKRGRGHLLIGFVKPVLDSVFLI